MRKIFSTVWRSILVGFAYTIANVVIGGIMMQMGFDFSVSAPQNPSLLLIINFLSGFLIGITLGPVAKMLTESRVRSIFIWATILFLNLISVTIEGYYFAPGLLQPALLPSILVLQFLSTLACSVAITYIFSSGPEEDHFMRMDHRSVYSWTWRFMISAASYLVFYFVFGSINYELFTRSYYETNSSLAVPEFSTIIKVVPLRAVLIVASLIPLITALHLPRKQLVVICGMILFAIGGIIPLCMQVGMLPAKMLIASGIEIFFQNFLTGAVAAVMLGHKAHTTHKSLEDVFYFVDIKGEVM